MLEVIIPAVLAILTGAGVLGGKRALDVRKWRTQLVDRLRQTMFELLTDPNVVASARMKLDQAADDLLERVGVDRSNEAIDRIVDAVIDQILAELAEKLFEMNMTKLQAELAGTVKAFEAKPAKKSR